MKTKYLSKSRKSVIRSFWRCIGYLWDRIFKNFFFDSRRSQRVRSSSLFTIESLYRIKLEIFKLMKKCTLNYLSSDGLNIKRTQKGGKVFVEIRAQELRDRNLLLSASITVEQLPRTPVDFAKERLNWRHCILTRPSTCKMLEGKYYRALDKAVFQSCVHQ